MPGMKVTVDAAMRARDISRPRAEHEAAANAGEPQPGQVAKQCQHAGSAGAPSNAAARGAAPAGPPKGRSPRRRRRRR